MSRFSTTQSANLLFAWTPLRSTFAARMVFPLAFMGMMACQSPTESAPAAEPAETQESTPAENPEVAPKPMAQFATDRGEKELFKLSDSSTVHLNAMSVLRFEEENWGEKRVLELDGQGLFTLPAGTDFAVNAPSGEITGTEASFEVESYAQSPVFAVSCYSGKVQVSVGGQTVSLNAGQRVDYKAGSGARGAIQAPSPEWLEGKSTYDFVPLPIVVADLKRQYDVFLDLPSNYKKKSFRGTFPHDNIEAALEAIFTYIDINYKYQDGTVIFL